ncbi:MAG TPA: acyl-CoA dehydrogenase family protein, partial [Nocardioides sp.]|nr:acyl-CoA dehydrogenase family protein [Nocardioides sp.]
MDFSLDEDLVALQGLAREIFGDLATTERLREVEATPAAYDEGLWRALGDAGILGLTVPEEHGGAGLDLAALAVVLEEQGRTVAPVPVWPHAVAALALAGRPDLLPGVADGSSRITLALEEYAADAAAPRTSAGLAGDGWRISGTKAVVP